MKSVMPRVAVFFLCSLTILPSVCCQSDTCYGLLQSNPATYLSSSDLLDAGIDSNVIYLYTSPLNRSTCNSGVLTTLNFCYSPSCSIESNGSPVFYVLLLLDNGVEYTVVYLHEEIEDSMFCDGRNASEMTMDCCCKQAPVNTPTPITVNSSFLLALLVPNDTSGGYLYEGDGTSLGVISSPVPPSMPQVGEVLELQRQAPRQIPNVLFQLVLEPTSPMSLGEVIIDFINKNTILVGGGGLFCLSLIVVCLGCVFIVGLKLKHNKLKKRVKRMKERGEEEGKKTKTRKKPANLQAIGVSNAVTTAAGGGDQYEEIQGVGGGEGYITMMPSPARMYSFRIPRNTSRDASFRRQEEFNLDENRLSESGGDYLSPAKDENTLYEQCKWLDLKQITRTHIELGYILGSGQFGTVMKGKWQQRHAGSEEEKESGGEVKEGEGEEEKAKQGEEEVAVKMLKKGSDAFSTIKFLREAAIMGQFSHPNVVKLHGVVTVGLPKMLVLELLSGGDLAKELIRMRPKSPEEAVESDVPHTLLSYCRQVASGMAYLSNKGFIHRDLAARNILLSEDGTCKIADFGMARDLIDDNYYITQGGRIPVKWTAPEAIHYKKYSPASDMWSFGAVMYEIWSLGHQPFENYNNAKTMEQVDKGLRLPPPPGCPKAVYSLMIQCWHSTASKRPTFPTIVQQLSLSDAKILKSRPPSTDGIEEAVTSLGEDLTSSINMFKDLQETYLQSTKL